MKVLPEGIQAQASRVNREVTFYVRRGFGDGADVGLSEADERAEAHKVFDEMIDVVLGRKYSAVPVERWAPMRKV